MVRLYKGKDCIGLAVVSEQTGQILGKITDIICSANLKIKYLQIVDKNSETKQCIPSLISNIGRDAVIVNSKDLPCPKDNKEKKVILFSKLKGLHIVGSDGTEIGELVDIIFELPYCEIQGLEVSEGFIGDILTGRHTISKDTIKKISQDCILIDF